MLNSQLLVSFEDACFDYARDSFDVEVQKRFYEFESQIANRLHLSDDELELLRNGPV